MVLFRFLLLQIIKCCFVLFSPRFFLELEVVLFTKEKNVLYVFGVVEWGCWDLNPGHHGFLAKPFRNAGFRFYMRFSHVLFAATTKCLLESKTCFFCCPSLSYSPD